MLLSEYGKSSTSFGLSFILSFTGSITGIFFSTDKSLIFKKSKTLVEDKNNTIFRKPKIKIIIL